MFTRNAKAERGHFMSYIDVNKMISARQASFCTGLSYETLKAICQTVNIPVVAIGGINKENILKLSGSGADGVALVSAIFAAKNIEEECKELRKLSEEMVNS